MAVVVFSFLVEMLIHMGAHRRATKHHVCFGYQCCVSFGVVLFVIVPRPQPYRREGIIQGDELGSRLSRRQLLRASPSVRLRQHLAVPDPLEGRAEHVSHQALGGVGDYRQIWVLVEELGEQAAPPERPLHGVVFLESFPVESVGLNGRVLDAIYR